MSTARCPTCSTLRPANAAYCPKCGSSFLGGTPAKPGRGEDSADFDELGAFAPYDFAYRRTLVDLSLWTGVKLGIGVAIGFALVALVLTTVAILVIANNVPGLRF